MNSVVETWRFLESGKCSAALNMAVDELLLMRMPEIGCPVARFYGWTDPAASFGYFQRIADVEAMTSLRPLVRRPTGGGIVPHDRDWTYSAVFPSGHSWYALSAIESYRKIHEWIQSAFQKSGISAGLAPEAAKAGSGQCFQGYEQFDLLHRGRKIAGAAQRRTKAGLLIQGSVQPPVSGMDRGVWHRAMLETMPEVQWQPFDFSPAFAERARSLAAVKYATDAFTKKR